MPKPTWHKFVAFADNASGIPDVLLFKIFSDDECCDSGHAYTLAAVEAKALGYSGIKVVGEFDAAFKKANLESMAWDGAYKLVCESVKIKPPLGDMLQVGHVLTKLVIEVAAPQKITANKVAQLVTKLINAGLSDAAEAPEDYEDTDMAKVFELQIADAKPLKDKLK